MLFLLIVVLIRNRLIESGWREELKLHAKEEQQQLEVEEKYLLQRLDLQSLIVQRWENRNFAGPVTPHMRQIYFNMLSVKEVLNLYMVYQMDFKLFGYELDPVYLSRAGNTHIIR